MKNIEIIVVSNRDCLYYNDGCKCDVCNNKREAEKWLENLLEDNLKN